MYDTLQMSAKQCQEAVKEWCFPNNHWDFSEKDSSFDESEVNKESMHHCCFWPGDEEDEAVCRKKDTKTLCGSI